METKKKSIRRSVISGCVMFVVLLGVFLALQSYVLFSRSLYESCDELLSGVIAHVERAIDMDAIETCIRTRESSEKIEQLQQVVDRMVDEFHLLYIYICIPADDGTGTMTSVIASTSEAERAAGDDESWGVMHVDEDSYKPEELLPYREAWANSPKTSSFEGNSEYGLCYTMCKPLVSADGETVALLCADLAVDDLHRNVDDFVGGNLALTFAIGALLVLALLIVLYRRAIGPILLLENGTRRVMNAQQEAQALSQLAQEAESVHTDNELETLSAAIAQMSHEMQSYVEETEKRVRSAEEAAEGMALVAYRDPLTHVKNRAAYNAKEAELEVDIVNGRAEFGIVMLDLNHLKKINDTYGHERGNHYIIGGCAVMCSVYDHSPVYRVGGDEFVVVLEGEDYRERERLLEQLRRRLRETSGDLGVEPWERYSAATGMAVFDGAVDRSVSQVFRRADESMYFNKQQMREGRDSGSA